MTTVPNSPNEFDCKAIQAAQIVEGVVGTGWATDAAGKFVYVTPSILSLIGMTLDEFNFPSEGQPSGLKRIIHPDDQDGAIETWRRCLQTGEHYNSEHRVLRADGSHGWSRSSGKPLRDSQGHILAWYGTIIDGDVPSAADVRFTSSPSATLEKKAAPDIPHSLNLVHPDDRTEAAHAAARAFWTGVSQVTRYRQLQADGSYRWTETRTEPGYRVSVDIDDLVTEREPPAEKVEQPAEDEAEAIRSARVIESIFGNGWAFDAEGRWIHLHPFAQNSLGVTLEYLNASLEEGYTAWKRLVHPDDYDQIASIWRHCLETGDHFNVEFRFRRANGIYVWARTAARPVRDNEGRITGWFGIALDNDVYKKTVEALRERERGLQQLIDTVPALIWTTTPDGTPTYVNKRFTDVTGAKLEDITAPDNSPSLNVIHAADVDAARQAITHSFATGEPYVQRYRQLRADGGYHWTETRAEPLRDEDGTIIQWYGVCVDIDDLVLAQKALQQSERRYRDLFHYMPIGLTQIDAGKLIPLFEELRDQGVTDLEAYIDEHPGFLSRAVEALEVEEVNQHIVEMFGAKNAEEMRGPIARYWQPSMATIRRSIEARYRGVEVFQEETKVAQMDGSVIDVLFKTARPGAVADKSLVGFVDITERKKAEEALRERERFLWQLVETLPAMIDCAAPDGEPVYRSRQLREYLGYDLDELDGKQKPRLTGTLDAGVHPDDVAGVKEHYAHSLATGEPYARKHRLRRFDGEYRWVETRAAAMRNAEGAIVQWNVICLDIDGEVRAQENLRLAQERLARAGQAATLAELSASIAHEVNQPLAAVVANSHACQRWLSADPPNMERARKTVERITRDANSVAEVVSRIRALFKQSSETRVRTSIASVIAEAREVMAEEASRRRVHLEIDVDDDLPTIMLDRVQIQQVLVNLIRNGMDAMSSDAGVERIVDIRTRHTDNVIRTEVSDHGPGVEFSDNIFEPFFTTKEDGMGMGLAICRSIVEAHGGRLWVERNEPRGAKFIFTLPIEVDRAP